MSQFRSEDMSLIQLFVQNEAAHDTMYELGEVGAIQFKDLNKEKSIFQRMFVGDVRKCDDMLRILQFISETVHQDKKLVSGGAVVPSMTVDEIHDKLQELDKEIKQLSANYTQLLKSEAELKEHKYVLSQGGRWLQGGQEISFNAPTTDDEDRVEMRSLLDDSEAQTQKVMGMLGHISGCIPTANLRDFGLTLFRATRGNMLLRHEDISESSLADPKSGEAVQKSVFIVFFSGERSRAKIDKIADSYGATKYRLPETPAEQEQLAQEIDERLRDLGAVLSKSRDFRRGRLEQVAGCLEPWGELARREKAVFHTLNKLNVDVTHQCLIAEGWCPTSKLEEVRDALRRGAVHAGAAVPTVLNVVRTRETPPTYFRSNKLTAGFQAIVDAYGMASYREFNPAIFSVVTFPFLFGVMFGDIGHGFIMTLAAGLLCLHEGRLSSLASHEMFGTVYQGRYAILLMGIFATYAGFIYNELFSVPQPFFAPTSWCGPDDTDPDCLSVPGASKNATQKWLRSSLEGAWDFGARTTTGTEVAWEVYPFGTDPGWSHASNKINAANTFKMKFAIVCGVAQMVAGICCKLANALRARDALTVWFVWLPEMVFINAIFGYLVALILAKWTTNWDATYVLNNEEVVSIPQRYCDADLSHLPCWTPPFVADRAAVPGYGGLLAQLPQAMWCMAPGAATAGCAVMRWKGQLVVEGNTFVTKALADPHTFNAAACEAGIGGCSLYKQPPPSILDTLINMFMEIGSVPVSQQLVPGQAPLQVFLILAAAVSVPMLLLPRPLLLKRRHERRAARHVPLADEDGGGGGGGGHEEVFDFGEEMVHQAIHTIEYVLSCISNTASYLRLWALSLAHAQLSEVFWEKAVVEIGLESGSPALVLATITAWSCFTLGVLMCMESLSAFLHALRLHWVEFMGKFYQGDGLCFQPFSFARLGEADAE